MKKALISIFIILICFQGFGQTLPTTPGVTSRSTLPVEDRYLFARQHFGLPRFLDSTAANFYGGLVDSCGAMYYDYTYSAIFFRACLSTGKKWIQLLPSGGGLGSGGWLLNYNTLLPQAYGNIGFGLVQNRGINFATNNTVWFALDSTGILPASGTVKVWGIDSVTKKLSFATVSSGSSGWSLTGNSGTNPAVNFIGTTDAQKFVTKVNSLKALTINTNLAIGLGTGEDYGTSGYVLSTNGSSTAPTWVNHTNLQHPISSLTNGLDDNSIDVADYIQEWDWSTLGDGDGFIIKSSSTTASPVGSRLMLINMEGANSGLTTALEVTNSHSSVSGDNIGATFSANGGGNSNYAAKFLRGTTSFGTAGSFAGILEILGSTSGAITIQPQAAAGTYNFNLPTTAGTSGHLLASGGGGAAPMTYVNPSTYTYTASNGLTMTGNDVQLGGVLGATTTISTSGQEFTITGSGMGLGIDFAGNDLTELGDISGNYENMKFSVDGINNIAYLKQGQDTAKFGINKIAPTEALDVLGNVRFSGALMPNNTAGTSGQYLTSAGAGTVPTWTTGSGGTVTGTGTANTGTKWTGTSSIGNASFTDDGTTITSSADLNLTTKRLLFNPSAAGEVLRISNPTSFSGANPYQIRIYDVSNGDGTYNQPVVSGFNQYGFNNPAKQGIYRSMEPKYLSSYMEDHLEVYMPPSVPHPSGETSRLSSATFVGGDSLANSTNQWDFRGNTINITNLTGTTPYVAFSGTKTSGAWSTIIRSPTEVSGIQFQGTGSDAITYFNALGSSPQLLFNNWSNITLAGGGSKFNYVPSTNVVTFLNASLPELTSPNVTGTLAGQNVILTPTNTTGIGVSLLNTTTTSGDVFKIAATGTAKITGGTGLNVAVSGALSTASQTTYGAQITNTHTGTTETNVGLKVTASGGTINTAIDAVGLVNIAGGTLTTASYQSLAVSGTQTSGQTMLGNTFTMTTAGSSGSAIGTRFSLNAGYTGAGANSPIEAYNAVAGTGTNMQLSSAFATPSINSGFTQYVSGSTTGTNVGGYSDVSGGNTNYGFVGKTVGTKNSAANIGVLGVAVNAGTTPIIIGGYFGMQTTEATIKATSVALAGDNGSTTANIFEARDAGTAVFTIADGGATTLTSTITASNLLSGTYTPTLTNSANIAASTAYSCQYMRVGNTVTVSGQVDIDPTLTATTTTLGITLPIASALANSNEVGGAAYSPTIAAMGAALLGDATNDRATLQFMSSDINNNSMFFTFTYRIL